MLNGHQIRIILQCICSWVFWTLNCATLFWGNINMHFLNISHAEMVIFSTLLAPCEGKPSSICGFPHSRPIMLIFEVLFYSSLNKLLTKHSSYQWLEMSWNSCDITVTLTQDRLYISLLTHWGREKIATIFQTMISDAFSWMKGFVFWLKFHLSLFLKVLLTITHRWFR